MSKVCDVCDDTHRFYHHGLERAVMCTSCPIPCQACAMHNGKGAFCMKTPCLCDCHAAIRYESTRCDWRSLFVYDPMTKVTSLHTGATLEDVERRMLNYFKTPVGIEMLSR